MRRLCTLAVGLAFIAAGFTGSTAAAASPLASFSLGASPHPAPGLATSLSAGLAPAPVLPAANPLDLSGSQIYDPNHVLETGIYQVQSSLKSLESHNMKLYVAILDNYSGYAPDEWNTHTAELTKMEPNSYLLSLNTTDNQFSASSTSGSVLNSAEVNDLAMNFAAPQFSTGEFASGISSFAQQLLQRSMATASPTGEATKGDAAQSSTNRWLIAILLAAMVVAVVLAIALYRRGTTPGANRRAQVDFDSIERADRDEELDQGDYYPPAANISSAGSLPNQPLMASTPPKASLVEALPLEPTGEEVSGVPNPQDEANYTNILSQLAELGDRCWGAAEDLSITELLLGESVAAPFAAALGDIQDRAAALLAELARADGALSASRYQDMAQEISDLRRYLSPLVSQYTKQRHQPGNLKHDLNRLAALWNQTRQKLAGAQKTQQIINNTYLSAPVAHSKANLTQATLLLKGAYKGILAGQESVKSGDEQTASRYARGAERAMIQAGEAVDNVQKLGSYLGLINDELSAMKIQLSADVDTIRDIDSHAAGPELAMTERALETANAALLGKADSIEALVKLRSVQANLYRAFAGFEPIAAKLSEVSSELDSRLQQAEQLRTLLETSLRLRRKTLVPHLLVDLSRCDQLLYQSRLKQQTDASAALSMLNTCTEMLVQLHHDLPVGFKPTNS